MDKTENKKLNEDEESDARSESDNASVLSSDDSVYPESESSKRPDMMDRYPSVPDYLKKAIYFAMYNVANSSVNDYRDKITKELRLVKKTEKLRKNQARLKVGHRVVLKGKRKLRQSQLERTSAENQDLNMVQQKLGVSKQQYVPEDIVLDAPLATSQTTSVSGPQDESSFTVDAAASSKACSSERSNIKTVSKPTQSAPEEAKSPLKPRPRPESGKTESNPGKSAPEKTKPPLKPNMGAAVGNVTERLRRMTLSQLDPDVLLQVATAKARLSPHTPPEDIFEKAVADIFDKGTVAKASDTPKLWWRQPYVEASFILEVAIVKSSIPDKRAEVYIQESMADLCKEKKRKRKPRVCPVNAWLSPETAQPCPPTKPCSSERDNIKTASKSENTAPEEAKPPLKPRPCPENSNPERPKTVTKPGKSAPEESRLPHKSQVCPESALPIPESIQPSPENARPQPPWWSQELTSLRKERDAARRRYSRHWRRRIRPPDAMAIEAELYKEYKAKDAIFKAELRRVQDTPPTTSQTTSVSGKQDETSFTTVAAAAPNPSSSERDHINTVSEPGKSAPGKAKPPLKPRPSLESARSCPENAPPRPVSNRQCQKSAKTVSEPAQSAPKEAKPPLKPRPRQESARPRQESARPCPQSKPCSSERSNIKSVSKPGVSASEEAKPPLKPNTGEAAANVTERLPRMTLTQLDPDVLLEVATTKIRLSAEDISFILKVAVVKSWNPDKPAADYIPDAESYLCRERKEIKKREKKPQVRPVSAQPCPESTRPCPENAKTVSKPGKSAPEEAKPPRKPRPSSESARPSPESSRSCSENARPSPEYAKKVSEPRKPALEEAKPPRKPRPCPPTKSCSSEQDNIKTVPEPGNSVSEETKPPLKPSMGAATENVTERLRRMTLSQLDPDVLLQVATAKARLSPDAPPENIFKEAVIDIFNKRMVAKANDTPKRWWRQPYVEASFILEVAIFKTWLPNKTAEVYVQEAMSDLCTKKKPRYRSEGDRPQNIWWSLELSALRIECTQARRRYARHRRRRIRPPDSTEIEAELLQKYQTAKIIYKAEIKRAKALVLET